MSASSWAIGVRNSSSHGVSITESIRLASSLTDAVISLLFMFSPLGSRRNEDLHPLQLIQRYKPEQSNRKSSSSHLTQFSLSLCLAEPCQCPVYPGMVLHVISSPLYDDVMRVARNVDRYHIETAGRDRDGFSLDGPGGTRTHTRNPAKNSDFG